MTTSISLRTIGPFKVTSIGLGCMNLSHAYGTPPSEEYATKLLHEAFDSGINFFDTAALYGLGHNENLMAKDFLKKNRSKIVLASKGGVGPADGKRVIDSRPESIRRDCEGSLRRLQVDVIDLYYLHRWDKKVPIEDVVGTLSDLIKEGKVRTIGLSEVSAATLRKAHAVHPITAIQTEYSLWSLNPEIAVLDVCKELDIAFVAFSPLGRGFLSDKRVELSDLEEKDIRLQMPRFSVENYPKNMQFHDTLKAIAKRENCTLAQLSLAWLLHLGQYITVIPGTTKLNHLHENIAADQISLSLQTMNEIAHALKTTPIFGSRYNPVSQSEVDTEQFAG
ncbi:MAG: aldo/keto reductase [Betaproteobacteria bacterium]